jgi:hypothetical protein
VSGAYPTTNPQIELQKLIYDTLVADAAVTALVDGVYDFVPPECWDGPHNGYISFGPVDVVEDDAACITAGIHTFQIDCWSRQKNSTHCKRVVDTVYAALHQQPLQLTINALAEMGVILRQVFRDPDGLTTHGVIQVQAQIEERVG